MVAGKTSGQGPLSWRNEPEEQDLVAKLNTKWWHFNLWPNYCFPAINTFITFYQLIIIHSKCPSLKGPSPNRTPSLDRTQILVAKYRECISCTSPPPPSKHLSNAKVPSLISQGLSYYNGIIISRETGKELGTDGDSNFHCTVEWPLVAAGGVFNQEIRVVPILGLFQRD